MLEKIEKDTLEWRGNAPVAPRFGDVYYSADNGLEETDFVFIKGTGAPDIWANQDHYVIAETGFGTGLNFLATWRAWKESGTKGRLTYISVEGFPLSREALEAAHATFPTVSPYAEALQAAWPPPAPGFHPRQFDNGQINLILLFGDATRMLGRLRATVDAWYLDGFAPAKNPDMWSDTIMDQIARLSRTGTRFATFTAAGFVKRALALRGFKVEKVRGYGRKRDRLIGEMTAPQPVLARPSTARPSTDWAAPAADHGGDIVVIGAGIAGAAIAHALRARGRQVTLVSGPQPLASNVPTAILSPSFLTTGQRSAEIYTSAFSYACSFAPYRTAWANQRGVTLVSKTEQEKAEQDTLARYLNWGSDWLEEREDGLHLPQSGSLDSKTALKALTEGVPHLNADIHRLERRSNRWYLYDKSNTCITDAASVVIATGMGSIELCDTEGYFELRPTLGQIELASPSAFGSLPATSLAYGGYVTAENPQGTRTIGSIYKRLDQMPAAIPQPTNTARKSILGNLQAATGHTVDPATITGSWTGIRAASPDHLPLVGPVPDWAGAEQQYALLAHDARKRGLGTPAYQPGLYLFTGFGSKGYQYAPMMADYLAAMMTGEPLPVPADLMASLSPLRFLIRRIVRSNG